MVADLTAFIFDFCVAPQPLSNQQPLFCHGGFSCEAEKEDFRKTGAY